jgi:iron complex outermembrane receptor protein
MNTKDRKLGLLGATILMSFGASAPAFAQQTQQNQPVAAPAAQAAEEEEEEDEAIIVTGSRLRRSEYNSSSPVSVITSEESTLEGLANTADILQESPATGGAFQVNTQLTGFVTTGGPGVSTVSLRGLGPQRTLVLLNGRRVGPAGTRGTVGPVDLNVIPSSLIERIEILKDGASSIYGSDAVAGVVNVITRRDLDGFEMNAFGDFSEDGGGQQSRLNLGWGTAWEGGYFNVGGEYFNRAALRNRHRDDTGCAADYVFNPSTGARIDYPNTDPGQDHPDDTYKCLGLFARVLRTNLGDMIYPDPGVTYPTSAQGNNAPPASGLVRQRRAGFPATFPYGHMDSYHYGQATAISPNTLTTLVANGGFDLGNAAELYAEFMFNRRESEQLSSRQFFPGVSTANPGNTFGATFAALLPIIPLASLRDQTVDYYRGVVGLRGELGNSGWDWDVFGQWSKSDAEYGTDIIYNDRVLAVTGASGCNQALITISGGQCSSLAAPIPWTSRRILEGQFNANEAAFLFTHEFGNTTYEQRLVEASVAGDAFDTWAGPVGVAAGVSYREEEIDDTPGFNERNGNLWGSTSAGRTAGSDAVSEAFLELGVPLMRDGFLGEALDLTLSGRYVDYDSYGEADVYKIGLNWALTDDFRIRATQGTSFRAPQLYELFLANQTSFTGQFGNDPCIQYELSTDPDLIANCAAAGVPVGYTQAGTSSITVITGGGAGHLAAEDSDARTLGVIWTPDGTGLSIALDYWDIEVNNEITTFGAANIANACYTSASGPAFGNTEPFCALVIRNNIPANWNPVTGGSGHQIVSINNSFVNVASQGNRGLDVNLRYEHELGPGTIQLNGYFTWTFEDVIQIFQNGVVNDFLGTTNNFRGPDFVGQTAVTYDLNDWTFTWAADIIGRGSDNDRTPAPTPSIINSAVYGQPIYLKRFTEPTVYHDFSVRRTFEGQGAFDELALVFGVVNAFDERPPALSTGFRRGTAALNSYDLVGRRAFVNLSVAW